MDEDTIFGYGVGKAQYIVEISYPHSWDSGYTAHFTTEEEMTEFVDRYKGLSGPNGTERYISISVGVVTRVH